MGLFRQVFGIYSWIWPLLVIIYITFTDAEKCKTGQFFDSAIGRCRPCFEKCQPGDLRKLCPESCKGWNATTPSPKCHKGEYWLEALGRCYKCSITCSQVLEGGKDVCPLECVGWNKKKPSPIKPSPTKPSPTKGSNTKNSRPNMRTADDDDKSHTLSWPYGVGLVIVVVLMPVTVAGVRKWRKRNHQGSIREVSTGRLPADEVVTSKVPGVWI
ncbi:uncharacterized protein LOC135493141 isoform X2 [Lineus longissimus]|uniref:uncharacterized protein LOC135493141 isoform X2 n=1 Tax=Lineus longissimus TaxID=88925 RepID=UPI00315D0504